MPTRRPDAANGWSARIFWRSFQAVMVAVAAAAVYLWWRGGMWKEGEMPTHGMLLTVAGCAGGLAFSWLLLWLGRRQAR